MNRVMGIDLGDVRIGIALSDMMKIVANGCETYKRTEEEKDLKHIAELAAANDVDIVVFGLPLNMDGTSGERVAKTRDFASKLAQLTAARIAYQDERLTTVTAERMLISADVRRDKRKQVIDKIAATIILQTYLDSGCR